ETARDGRDRLDPRLHLERRGLARAPRGAPGTDGADGDLRGAPGLVAPGAGGREPLAHLSRAGRDAARLRGGARVHARRAAAGDGASLLRLVGGTDQRLLPAPPPPRTAPGR